MSKKPDYQVDNIGKVSIDLLREIRVAIPDNVMQPGRSLCDRVITDRCCHSGDVFDIGTASLVHLSSVSAIGECFSSLN